MKREILFKAQRADGKGWVEGFFTKKEIGSLICPVIERHSEWDNGDSMEAIEINGETVCQYTGLFDKNGVKIFEGDTYHQGDERIRFNVVFRDGRFAGSKVGDRSLSGLDHFIKKIEVTGNIHDNK